MSCQCNINASFVNLTQNEIINLLVENTKIDTKATQLYLDRFKSRPGTRTSSWVYGVSGLFILILIGVLILLNDTLHCVMSRQAKHALYVDREQDRATLDVSN